MRRFLTATLIGLLWTALFGLSLFAQTGPEEMPSSPSFTIPPFEPPAGATITVTTGLDNLTGNGDCTLREAIQSANTDAAVDACPAGDGEDLILLPAGSYGLSLAGRSEDENATGDLDIRSSLVISGWGSATTIIDANQIDRVLHVLTATVEIRGVTVQNGRAADGANSGCGFNGDYGCSGEPGGGIANSGSTVLVDVIVQNSRSGDGGGNAVYFGHGGDGGGIVNEEKLKIFASQVINNRAGDGKAFSTSGGNGGGVYNLGVLLGDSLIVSTNQTGLGGPVPKGSPHSGDGGGISNQGTLTITNSRVLSNSASGNGAGVYNTGNAWFFASAIGHNTSDYWGGGGIQNRGEMILDRCSIYSNVVRARGAGGGLYNLGSVRLVNCTVSDNKSGKGSAWVLPGPGSPGGGAGGIFNQGSLFVESTTIAYNQTGEGYCWPGGDCAAGGSGGGLANDGGAVTIHNSIIAQNTVADGGSGPDCTGIVSSQGTNFIGTADGCTLAGAGDDILNQHAFLGPLTDNGGPTPTHALLPYSHALDAGSCADIGGAPILTDQRGEPRPQGAGCDLGAFESALSTIPLPETLHLPLIRQQPN